MKKNVKKELLFTVDGFEVYSNSSYLIADKKDGDAPSGFVEAGVSKLPSDGVGDSFQIPAREVAPNVWKWDTGFYEYSPCYADTPVAEQKTIIKNLNKNLVEPYRQFMGDPELFKNSKDEDYSGLLFNARSGKKYYTENPNDRMELYFAILSATVTPPGKEGDSKYRRSFFMIYDTTVQLKQKDENNLSFFKAAGMFSNLFTQDRSRLLAILSWVGMSKVAESVDEGTLTTMFHDFTKSRPDVVTRFLDAVAESENDAYKAKIIIFRNLKERATKTSKFQKSATGIFHYNGIEVGPDLQAAADNISKNPELGEIRNEVLAL